MLDLSSLFVMVPHYSCIQVGSAIIFLLTIRVEFVMKKLFRVSRSFDGAR